MKNKMKKYLIYTIIFFVMSLQSISQVWVEPQAKWYYNYSNVAQQGYVEWDYINDVVIQGKTCEEIKGKKIVYTMTSPTSGYVYSHTEVLPTYYTYTNGDTVFYLSNNGNVFRPLYIFSGSEGDEWIIDISYDQLSCIYDTTRVRIDGVGVQTVNNVNYRWISISTVHNDFSGYLFSGKAIERFGMFELNNAATTLFPVENVRRHVLSNACDSNLIIEYDMCEFHCFSDNMFSSSSTCSSPNVGVVENSINHLIKIFPNPSQNQKVTLNYDNLSIIDVKAYTSIGKEVEVYQNMNTLTFNQTGMFYLKVLTNKGVVNKKVIIE